MEQKVPFRAPDIIKNKSFMIINVYNNLTKDKKLQLGQLERMIADAGTYMNTCDEAIYKRIVLLYYYL